MRLQTLPARAGGSTGPAPERCAVPPYRRPTGNAGRTGPKGEPDADRSCRRIRQAPPGGWILYAMLLAGVSAATAFCAAKGIPLVQTTHQQGHISAALLRPAGQTCSAKKSWCSMCPAEPLTFCTARGRTALPALAPAATCTRARQWTALACGWAMRSRRASMSASWRQPAPRTSNPKSACAAQPAAFPACRTSAKSCWQRAKPGICQ